MPAAPRWWSKLNEIESTVEHFDCPVLDRESIEKVFGLGRRRAQDLMRVCGGYQAGRTWLIERLVLLEYLRHRKRDRSYQGEMARRIRLADSIEAAQRTVQAHRVRIVPGNPASGLLPPGCELSPGQLSLHFSSPEELLRMLYDLSQGIASDYEAFAAAAGKPVPAPAP
jgi:hypothetical protein